jgi:hypothetical protein
MADPMTTAEIAAFISDKKDGDEIKKYDIATFGSVAPTAGYGGKRWSGRSSKRRRRKSRKKRRKSRKSKKRKSRRRRRR